MRAERKIVPAGQGNGQVKALLTELLHSGWRGFLSLEPHLTDFTGLAALEQEAKQRNSTLDGKSAWKLALTALRELLSEIPEAKELMV